MSGVRFKDRHITMLAGCRLVEHSDESVVGSLKQKVTTFCEELMNGGGGRDSDDGNSCQSPYLMAMLVDLYKESGEDEDTKKAVEVRRQGSLSCLGISYLYDLCFFSYARIWLESTTLSERNIGNLLPMDCRKRDLET